MPQRRISAPRLVLALLLGAGALAMAVLSLVLSPANQAGAAQATHDTGNVTTAAQGAPTLDALRAQLRAYARQVRPTQRQAPVARPNSVDQGNGYIAGRIIAGATGISNTTVTLRRYRPSDNSGDSAVMTTTTTITGSFTFSTPPTLADNLAYYVEFGPQVSNPALAFLWDSYDVEGYTAGDQLTLEPMDVSNIPLVAPPDNATVEYPVTFQWTRRSLTTDTYALFLLPLSGSGLRSDFLGYVNELTIPEQSNIRRGEPYDWGILGADSVGEGGAGFSQQRTVTFGQAQATATATVQATAQVTPTGTSTTVPVTATATITAPTVTNTPTPTNTSAPSPTPGAQTLLAGLTSDNSLVYFSSAAPDTILATVTITGLDAGETLWGIDTRPATGQLYAISSASRLYTINRSTGAASLIGAAPLTPTLSGTAFGFDFNPTVDRIRIVSNTGQDLRVHPDTGAVVAVDGTLAFATGDVNAGQTPAVVGAAYTNNFAGANATTLYNIDAGLDILVSQIPPNSGTLNTIGALGVNATAMTGFDIAPGTGAAFAALMLQGRSTSDLYTINLSTGAAALVGTIGDGLAILGLTVVPDAPAQATVTPTVEVTATETPVAPTETVVVGTPTGTATATPEAPTSTTTPVPATATPTVSLPTGTATQAPATFTATPVPATVTSTPAPATVTATPRPTGTPFTCGDGNLCAGNIVIRAYIDFGCDGFFNRGTDYPLFGASVTATLPDGSTRVGIVDENGNALISGVNLTPTGSVQVSIDTPPLPTWVQQFGYGLAACSNSLTTRTVMRSNFGVLGVTFVDFRFGLTQP